MASIHGAAQEGDLMEVMRLVAADPALINTHDEEGYLPLMWAADYGHVAVAEHLLLKGAARLNDRAPASVEA